MDNLDELTSLTEDEKKLIKIKPIINAQLPEGLFKACQDGDLELVKILVKKGADVTEKQNLAVRAAAGYGHLEVLKYLIQKGAKVSDDHNGALRFASYQNQLHIVKYLVENQDVDINDYIAKYGRSSCPLGLATEKGHVDIIEYLKSKGAK